MGNKGKFTYTKTSKIIKDIHGHRRSYSIGASIDFNPWIT